jgi:hypothetical protein
VFTLVIHGYVFVIILNGKILCLEQDSVCWLVITEPSTLYRLFISMVKLSLFWWIAPLELPAATKTVRCVYSLLQSEAKFGAMSGRRIAALKRALQR